MEGFLNFLPLLNIHAGAIVGSPGPVLPPVDHFINPPEHSESGLILIPHHECLEHAIARVRPPHNLMPQQSGLQTPLVVLVGLDVGGEVIGHLGIVHRLFCGCRDYVDAGPHCQLARSCAFAAVAFYYQLGISALRVHLSPLLYNTAPIWVMPILIRQKQSFRVHYMGVANQIPKIQYSKQNTVNREVTKMDKYLEMLQSMQTIPEKDVRLICEKVKQILMEESNMVLVRAPVTVCGDIHGQFHDLLEIFQICGKLPNTNYLFMGDYVDRGFHSVQTFLYVLILKIKHRSRITILRGNHENREINRLYGFYDECLRKYGTESVWKLFTDIFMYLPLSAVIENEVFSLHGGLSPEIEQLDQIKSINRVQDIPHNGALCDLLWSDPADEGKSGFGPSPRGAGFCWGEDISNKFNHRNNLKMICRAHQLIMDGYNYSHKKKCVTIFSAPNYCYRCGNCASVLEISDDLSYYYQKYDPSPKEKQNEPTKRVPSYFL